MKLLLCLLLLVGSAHSAPPQTLQFAPDWFRISMENEPVTLDWHRARTQNDRFILSLLMRGLLKYDSQAKLICDLCENFQIQDDRKTLIFDLKPELWSDGEKLQASHFVDSFQRLLDPAQKNPYSEEFLLIEGAYAKKPGLRLAVKADSPLRLSIRLSKPSSLFPHLLTTPQSFPIRKEFLKNQKNMWEEHAMGAVLGPYMLGTWERGKRIVIEANQTFKAERPAYRVEFIIGSHKDLVAKFKSSKIEILSNPSAEDLVQLKGQNLMNVNPYWATRNLIFNSTKAPLAELGFRRSILYALNRESLPAFLKNGDRAATGLIPMGLPGYRPLPLITADLTRARAERSRTTVGEKAVTLDLLVLDNAAERKVGEWLSEKLKAIDIEIKLKPKNSRDFYASLEKGDFTLALHVWTYETASPLELLRTFETNSTKNISHFTNVGYDALIEKALREDSQMGANSQAVIEQVTQALEVDSVGIIPLTFPSQPFLLARWVSNFVTTPFGDPDLSKIRLIQLNK